MSAFDSGRSLNGRLLPAEDAEQRKENKKIARLAELFFCVFNFSLVGCRGLRCGFPRSPGHFAFVFFHADQAPLRVSQNDSSGQAVFLGQLVEEGAIYSQSSSRGSGKWRQLTTSK